MNWVRKHLDIAGLAVTALWPWLYYLPVTLGQQVFAYGDINWLFSPIRAELARALARGSLPLWSPGLEGGFPLFAEGEVAALYPVNLIAYRFLPVYIANSYTILFHLAWASVGMYLLARSVRFSTAGALLAGFVFGSSGFMIGHLSHLPHVAVSSWLPWLILFQQRYWQARLAGRDARVWLVLCSLSIGFMWLGGFPQIALINLAVYGLSGLVGPVIWGEPTAGLRNLVSTERVWLASSITATVGTTVFGTAFAAIQLLPTYELMGLSIRAQEMAKSFVTNYSLDPSHLTQFLVPFWQLGAPTASNMEYWGYVGVLPFLLMLGAILLRRDARTLFFFGIAALALVLALGGNTPLYDWLSSIPVFDRFRVPARFLLPFTFAAAFLAAAGLEALADRLHDATWDWSSVSTAAIFAVLCAVAAFEAYRQPIESWMTAWQLLPLLFMGGSVGLFALAWTRKVSTRLLVTLAVAMTILDLIAVRGPFLQTLSGLSSPAEWIDPPRSAQAMDNAQLAVRVLAEKPPWTAAAARGSLWQNLALIYGKESAKSYLPSLGLERNKEYVDAMTPGMRNLMNVRYYLLPLEVPDYDASIPAPLDESEPNGGLTIELLSHQPAIPPTHVVRLQVTSFTDHTGELPDDKLVGEIVLDTSTGAAITLPIRLGEETADWAWDALAASGAAKHRRPEATLSFPAFLKSFGRTFTGHRYEAQYVVAGNRDPLVVTSVGVRSFLPEAGLTIEHIDLIDETGHRTSLAALLHRNDLALAFRSHTTAMWENRDVLPRAFVVHRAETMPDEMALVRLKEPDFPYDQVALLADTSAFDLAQNTEQAESKDAGTITSYAQERVVVRVETDRPGFLILADSWYPGWATSIDDEATPMYRADYVFRAVAVPSGKHTVVFEYRPASFFWGAIISVMSAAFGAGLLFWQGGRTRS